MLMQSNLSSGALHKITLCRTWNLKLALQFLQESGIQLIGCTEKTQDNIYKADYSIPTAIIMGSEEDGVSAEFLRMCDTKAKNTNEWKNCFFECFCSHWGYFV